MTNKEQFHCVGCGGTLTSMDAEVVFVTGFYRVIHPLGLCKACFIQSQENEQQRDALVADFTRSYNAEHLLVAYS
ncbi:hypothetical protein [Paenibacillus sp. CF384]|uniref:hypothetical protein n=1 Tax=Paenibacillus sp. CF384 TaxID=1884382 RepID=UPI00089779B5|nr:hypothetical protein [Paenibacillus sp. CF384]SDX66008.1 hypothetical protein SAMN05518855_101844 [Paenibacillus sp. CF384]